MVSVTAVVCSVSDPWINSDKLCGSVLQVNMTARLLLVRGHCT